MMISICVSASSSASCLHGGKKNLVYSLRWFLLWEQVGQIVERGEGFDDPVGLA